jgi:hypothetical protein
MGIRSEIRKTFKTVTSQTLESLLSLHTSSMMKQFAKSTDVNTPLKVSEGFDELMDTSFYEYFNGTPINDALPEEYPIQEGFNFGDGWAVQGIAYTSNKLNNNFADMPILILGREDEFLTRGDIEYVTEISQINFQGENVFVAYLTEQEPVVEFEIEPLRSKQFGNELEPVVLANHAGSLVIYSEKSVPWLDLFKDVTLSGNCISGYGPLDVNYQYDDLFGYRLNTRDFVQKPHLNALTQIMLEMGYDVRETVELRDYEQRDAAIEAVFGINLFQEDDESLGNEELLYARQPDEKRVIVESAEKQNLVVLFNQDSPLVYLYTSEPQDWDNILFKEWVPRSQYLGIIPAVKIQNPEFAFDGVYGVEVNLNAFLASSQWGNCQDAITNLLRNQGFNVEIGLHGGWHNSKENAKAIINKKLSISKVLIAYEFDDKRLLFYSDVFCAVTPGGWGNVLWDTPNIMEFLGSEFTEQEMYGLNNFDYELPDGFTSGMVLLKRGFDSDMLDKVMTAYQEAGFEVRSEERSSGVGYIGAELKEHLGIANS